MGALSLIEIKMAVLPCREINTKNYVSFADFKSFLLILSHFIDHFYNIFFLDHQSPGPVYRIHLKTTAFYYFQHRHLLNSSICQSL